METGVANKKGEQTQQSYAIVITTLAMQCTRAKQKNCLTIEMSAELVGRVLS